MIPPAPSRRRILFLDDDPDRASAFLLQCPGATWVQTAEHCMECLEEPWDEVHLDHDLGGEVFVDHNREDCGMAVVRWLCDQPRDHLTATRFIVHTHNQNAACVMQLHLETTGYTVSVRPFGSEAFNQDLTANTKIRISWKDRIVRWLRKIG